MKKIAIHHHPGSFSDRWIAYCEKNNIPYKIVNAFDNDIIKQLQDCKGFMWHHNHAIYKDVIAAKKILFALEHAGIKVFPDFKTGWHFDDKVAQKYLLEALLVPMVPSYVFYDKKNAINWVKQTNFPKVFKLKGGAGASNVLLINSKKEALKLIKKAFGKGFPQYNRFSSLKEQFRKFKEKKESFLFLLKGLIRVFIIPEFARKQSNEKGYVYFQDFIPNLDSDIRIQVINKKIIGLKRFVRKNDFRASGSGNFVELNQNNIDIQLLKIAQKTNQLIDSDCLTIDFIYHNEKPLIVELSYGFPVNFYDNCSGYWDENLKWHEEKFITQEWIIKNIIKDIKL